MVWVQGWWHLGDGRGLGLVEVQGWWRFRGSGDLGVVGV